MMSNNRGKCPRPTRAVPALGQMMHDAPAIVHEEQNRSQLTRFLRSSFRIRDSSTCAAHYIFPTFASVAFLVYDLDELTANLKKLDSAMNRIAQLKETHCNSYVCVIMAKNSSSRETRTLMALQLRFPSKPGFIPCLSNKDCFNAMLALCQAYTKEALSHKLAGFKQREAEAVSLEATIDVLMAIPGMKIQDCRELARGLGGLANIASASVDDILRHTSLSRTQAEELNNFFAEDASIV